MKNKYLLLSLLCMSCITNNQNKEANPKEYKLKKVEKKIEIREEPRGRNNLKGYELISAAKKIIDTSGDLKKAMALLEKAKTADYGFCGNAYASANWEINFLTARIYQQNKNYKMALRQLEKYKEYGLGGNEEAKDSLKLKIQKDMDFYNKNKK